MAEQMKPASPQQAPDPAKSYERANPADESGMGRLDTDPPHKSQQPDRMEHAVGNKQEPTRQINGEDPPQPDHSMHDEEPMGSDLAPQDINDPRQKRHPRTEGRGGTP